MRQKYFKNSITAVLITSFILIPLGTIPKKAEAQNLGAYTKGLVPAIAQLPLCRNKLTSATKFLFGQSAELMAAIATKGKEKVEQELLEKIQKESASQVGSISTYDAEANKKINELKKQLSEVQKSTASLDTSKTCLDSIGRLVVKMLVQKITLSTVSWINSGFDGQPAFIQDPGKFFGDIAKNEILQFGLEINNPELFPFGKAWLQNQALAYNRKFADNARYSLDDMIRSTTPQYSAQSFRLDFSQGGWDAWSAMTQVPANNPLGFQLMASDELQRRLEGTQQSVAQDTREALQAANGFLGDNRCVDPKGLTRQQDQEGTIARGKIGPEPNPAAAKYNPTNALANVSAQQQYDSDLADWQNKMAAAPVCNKWEYVTPGKLIADAATDAIGYPKDSLLNVDTLNDAVAAILDALLSRFSSDFMEKGFANLGNQGADGTFVYNPESARTDYSSQTEKDFTPTQLTSSWLSANPDFNIRTDLTVALIDEQRTHSDKLKLQNKELYSTTDGKDYKMNTASGVSNASGLIPAIAQLDYCIPGPHPGWEQDSRQLLDAATNVILPITLQDVEKHGLNNIVGAAQALAPLAGSAIAIATGFKIGGTLGSVIPGLGTIVGGIAGALIGWGVGVLVGNDDPKALRQYFSLQIQGLIGIDTNYPDEASKVVTSLLSKQGAVQALNVMLERYITIMHKVYNPKVLPSVHKEAATEYNKLQGYGQIILNNEEAISTTKNVVNTLGEIKNAIDALNTKFPNGGDQYENGLKTQINAFGRLSANMVNGDDVASADNLLKQIVDEKKYIYADLLKGPLGCEKDLELGRQGLSTQLYNTKRMDYPFPIIYTYDVPAGGSIPDPWSSGFVNKTNPSATATLGPGFLSYYSFQTAGGRVPVACIADENGTVPRCDLKIDDLVPISDKDKNDRRLGAIGTPNRDPGGPFEYSIGAY